MGSQEAVNSGKGGAANDSAGCGDSVSPKGCRCGGAEERGSDLGTGEALMGSLLEVRGGGMDSATDEEAMH